MAETPSQRRQSPRAQVSAPVVLWVDTTGRPRRSSGHLVDLGAGGAFLELDGSYPVGTCLRLRFRLDLLGEINCRAVIRHCDGTGAGVKFLDLEDPEEARLLALIIQLNV